MVGDTVTVRLTAQDTARYFRLSLSQSTEIALFAATALPSTEIHVFDSLGTQILAVVYPQPGRALLEARSPRFQLTAGATYFVRIKFFEPAAGTVRLFAYLVNRAPEHHAAALAVEEVVADETLETSADVDEFTLPGNVGQEVIGFLQALDPSLSNVARLVADVSLPSGARPFVNAGVGDLEAAATGRFVVPGTDPVKLILTAESQNWIPEASQPGLVRFAFRAIDRAPEQGGAVVAVGDTVGGGSIDFVGDVDEYTVQGAAGSELNVFFQAENDTATSVLSLSVIPTPTSFIGRVESRGTDGVLTRQASGRFSIPPSGSLTLQVAGVSDLIELHRGGYRFFVYQVDRAPEASAASLTLGQTIGGETIELPGDLDEFLLNVPATSLANFVLSGPMTGGGIRLTRSLIGSGAVVGDLALFNGEPVGAEVGIGSRTFRLDAGSYKLTVDGNSTLGDGHRGAYKLHAFAIDSLPEGVEPAVVIESSVTEQLTPVGDHDAYRLTGNAGDLLDLTLTGGSNGQAPGILAFVRRPGSSSLAIVTASGTGDPPNHSGRFELPADGSYELFVGGINEGLIVTEVGPYQLGIARYPTTLEHASATLTVGVETITEGLDELGDVDDFFLSAVPGTEVQVVFKKGSINGGLLQVQVANAANGSTLKTMASAGFDQATGRITVPASGSLRIRFFESRFPECFSIGCAFRVLDSYRFTPLVISRAPEMANASLTLGAVAQEAIDPVGDVDEFTFSGTAGQQVRVYFQSISLLASREGILSVFDPSGVELAELRVGNPSGDIRNVGTGPLSLPATGTYRIRVQLVSDQEGTGQYGILVE